MFADEPEPDKISRLDVYNDFKRLSSFVYQTQHRAEVEMMLAKV